MLAFPQKDKSAKVAMIVVSLLLLIGILSYTFWDELPFTGNASVPPALAAKAPMPAVTTPVQPALPPAGPDQAEAAPVNAASSTPVVVADAALFVRQSAGNMHKLTELTAALEEAKLLVAIGEQEAKLKKLAEPVVSAGPQIVLPPPAPGNRLEGAAPAIPPVRTQILSVQGIDGNVVATVMTPSGNRNLKVGDTFGTGKVERISEEGVWIREGRKTRLMTVEE